MEISLKLGSKTYTADSASEMEINDLINKLVLYNSKTYPFFINILITICDIENVDENNKEALAYTYPDYINERIKIAINWDMVAELNLNDKELLFIIFHELLHNYFYHFTRMKEEKKINPILSNIVTDYYCNTMLFEMLKLSKKDFVDKGLDIVDYNKLEQIAGKNLPFDNFDDAPTEPKLFKWFLDNCDNLDQKLEKLFGGNGEGKQQIDDHDASEEKSKQNADNFNKSKQIKTNGKIANISQDDLDSIMDAKLNNIEQEISSNISASGDESELIRHKVKITKKDDFLNFLDLKRIISKEISQTYVKSYKRASRTRQSNKVVFKGKTKEFGKKILVAVDVSGSIGDEELKRCYEMLNGFLDKNKNNTILDVVYWSSCKVEEKHFHQNIKDIKDLLKFKIHSSGGTDVSYLHKWIKDFYYNQYIGVINITDGYFDYEKDIPSNVLQYDFVLTEMNMEDKIANGYNDKRIKTHTIKKPGF